MAMLLRSVSVQTNRRHEFVNITPEVEREVSLSGVREGVALLRSRHVTGAVTCQENDPTVHRDALDLLDSLLPLSKQYHHGYEGAANATAHLANMLLFGDSTWAPIRDGRLDLGTWQSIFFVELFEPRQRAVDIAIIGE